MVLRFKFSLVSTIPHHMIGLTLNGSCLLLVLCQSYNTFIRYHIDITYRNERAIKPHSYLRFSNFMPDAQVTWA